MLYYMVFILQNTVCITQKKPLFLLKQASSSAVPNPDLLPIFFWFPLPETSWHPPPRPPRLRGTMPSSPAPVVHICQELGARRKTGEAAAGRARTPRMQGLRWFSRYVASKHGNKIPTFHQLYQNASNRVIRIFSINLETSHLRWFMTNLGLKKWKHHIFWEKNWNQTSQATRKTTQRL